MISEKVLFEEARFKLVLESKLKCADAISQGPTYVVIAVQLEESFRKVA